jgi:hypothetical protein
MTVDVPIIEVVSKPLSGLRSRRAGGLNRRNIFNISRIEPFGSIPPQAERLDLRGDFETTSSKGLKIKAELSSTNNVIA